MSSNCLKKVMTSCSLLKNNLIPSQSKIPATDNLDYFVLLDKKVSRAWGFHRYLHWRFLITMRCMASDVLSVLEWVETWEAVGGDGLVWFDCRRFFSFGETLSFSSISSPSVDSLGNWKESSLCVGVIIMRLNGFRDYSFDSICSCFDNLRYFYGYFSLFD